MSSSRGKCRAHTAAKDANPQGRGCRGAVDCLVLQRVDNPKHGRNFHYRRVGLCKYHTQQWLDWLAGKAEPLMYKPIQPPVIAQLEDVPPPEGESESAAADDDGYVDRSYPDMPWEPT